MENKSYWVIIEKSINLLISFGFGIFFARILGPSDYGILNYCYSIIAVFNLISMFGIDSVMVKELLAYNDNEGLVIGTSSFIRCIISIICVILSIIFTLLLKNNQIIIIIVFIESISMIINSFSFINDYCYVHHYFKYNSLFKIISYIIVAIYKIIILLKCPNIIYLSYSIIIDAIIINLFYYFLIKKNHLKLSYSYSYLKILLKKSFPFLLSSLLSICLISTDKIMIGNILSQKDVGIYGLALVICNAWNVLPDSLITIFNPNICLLKKINQQKYHKKLVLLYRLIFYLGLICSIIIIILSKYLIPFILGIKYLNAFPVICIGVWYTIFLNLSIARKIWMVNENKNKYSGIFLLYSFTLNIIFNYFFLKIWGIKGIIFSSLITELLNIFIFPLFYDLKESVNDILKAIFFITLNKK